MNPLTKNPETGFLESKTQNSFSTRNYPFDSTRKTIFLETARSLVNERKWPTIHELCKSVGITVKCFYEHLKADTAFLEEWTEIKENVKSLYTEKLAIKADSKMGTLANLAILKWLENGTWNQESRVQIGYDELSPRKAFIDIKQVQDAELIENPHLIKGNIEP